MNLIDAFRSYLPTELVDRVSNNLNESPSGISKAITAGIPAVLAGFINRAEGGDTTGLLKDAQEANNSGLLSNPQGLLSGGSNFLSGGLNRILGMFGGDGNSIVSAIANFAGIKSGSVQSLLGILAPLGLGVLGRHARENNLSAQGLQSFLASQKDSVLSALPTGFSLGNLFGSAKSRFDPISNKETSSTTYVDEKPKAGGNRLIWILVTLAVVALLWYLLSKGCNNAATSTNTTDTTVIQSTPVDTGSSAMNNATDNITDRVSTKVKLSDGTEIDAYKGGVEDQLVACLNDDGCTAGKDKWFDFDNLNFEVGSAKLTNESMQQVNNIAAILKAYPKAKIKIGGYTDKTGDAKANKKLSQERAETVLNAIKSANAKASQLAGAEGYGSEFAKVDASAADSERRKDRRIAVQLREK